MIIKEQLYFGNIFFGWTEPWCFRYMLECKDSNSFSVANNILHMVCQRLCLYGKEIWFQNPAASYVKICKRLVRRAAAASKQIYVEKYQRHNSWVHANICVSWFHYKKPWNLVS